MASSAHLAVCLRNLHASLGAYPHSLQGNCTQQVEPRLCMSSELVPCVVSQPPLSLIRVLLVLVSFFSREKKVGHRVQKVYSPRPDLVTGSAHPLHIGSGSVGRLFAHLLPASCSGPPAGLMLMECYLSGLSTLACTGQDFHAAPAIVLDINYDSSAWLIRAGAQTELYFHIC